MAVRSAQLTAASGATISRGFTRQGVPSMISPHPSHRFATLSLMIVRMSMPMISIGGMVSAGHVWGDRPVSTREGAYSYGDGYVTVQSMGVAKASVVITRNVEDVFGVLSDVTNVPKWNRNAIEVTPLTSGPMRVGSRRRAVSRTFGGGTQTNEAEMVEFEPRRRMVVKSVGGPFVWRGGGGVGGSLGGKGRDR